MEIANLIRLRGDTEQKRSRSLLVRGSSRPAGTGIYVSSKIAASGVFTSQHETTCEFSLIKTTYGFYRLAPDNPFLTPEQIAMLDSRGCIRVGSVVQAGDILASVVYVKNALKGEAPVPSGTQRVHNDSLETPLGWSGAIVKSVQALARRDLPRTTPPDVVGHVTVQLIREEALAIGDVLAADGNGLGIVAKIDQELARSVDLELDGWHSRLGLARGPDQAN